jgi:hypothetical protein
MGNHKMGHRQIQVTLSSPKVSEVVVTKIWRYPDFKKYVDPYGHVRVFNSVMKANAETFEKYIINSFNYMLRNTTLN